MIFTFKRMTGHASLKKTLAMFLMAALLLAGRPAGAEPFALAIGEVDFDANTLLKIDLATNTVIGPPIHLGLGKTTGIAFTPDGKRAYIATGKGFSQSSANIDAYVSVVDIATNTVLQKISVDNPNPFAVSSLVISSNGERIYLTTGLDFITGDFSKAAVSVIDTTTNTVVSTIPLGLTQGAIPEPAIPMDLAITPDGQRVYVVIDNDNRIAIIDTTTNAIVGSIPVEGRPGRIEINTNRKFAYLTNFNNNENTTAILTIDLETNSVVNTLPPINQPSTVSISPDGQHLFVTNNMDSTSFAADEITVVNTGNNLISATLSIGGILGQRLFMPRKVVFTSDGTRAYVSFFNVDGLSNSGIVGINVADNTIVNTISINGVIFAITPTTKPTSVAFSNFSANVEVEGLRAFELKGNFTLGSASNGIAPLTEPVTLQVGAFTATIPAGAFKKQKTGIFKFEGNINGLTLGVKITPLGGNRFAFKAEAKNANLAGVVNPAPVTLTIGGDSGKTSATIKF